MSIPSSDHSNKLPYHNSQETMSSSLDRGVWWGLGWGHELTRGVRAPPLVSDVSVGYGGAWVGAEIFGENETNS
ncbi:hypothetical protein HanPI659440_Chr10g0393341 [Helianthus annuus]|nr:hypothetical protein HanPI659440_Chr10g0393341 [Helianthus annuus]